MNKLILSAHHDTSGQCETSNDAKRLMWHGSKVAFMSMRWHLCPTWRDWPTINIEFVPNETRVPNVAGLFNSVVPNEATINVSWHKSVFNYQSYYVPNLMWHPTKPHSFGWIVFSNKHEPLDASSHFHDWFSALQLKSNSNSLNYELLANINCNSLILVWNSLPDILVSAPNPTSFKKALIRDDLSEFLHFPTFFAWLIFFRFHSHFRCFYLLLLNCLFVFGYNKRFLTCIYFKY